MRLFLALLIGLIAVYEGYSLAQRPHASSPPVVVQRGVASWYGREEDGGPTASGETFNRHEFTAASRHLPFNTVVRVTNERNGRTVDVRINDRGPYVGGRILDLSEAAADSLDMRDSGTAPVKIQLVQPPTTGAASSP